MNFFPESIRGMAWAFADERHALAVNRCAFLHDLLIPFLLSGWDCSKSSAVILGPKSDTGSAASLGTVSWKLERSSGGGSIASYHLTLCLFVLDPLFLTGGGQSNSGSSNMLPGLTISGSSWLTKSS